MNKMPLVQQKRRGFSTTNNIFLHWEEFSLDWNHPKMSPCSVLEEGNKTQERCWQSHDSVRGKRETHLLLWRGKGGNKVSWGGGIMVYWLSAM